jgi:hypothetical protein
MRLWVLLSAFIGLCGAAQAETVFYSCKTTQSNGDWIPKELYIAVSETGAVVNDPVINAIYGKPIPANIETDNAKRITFRWKLSGTKDASGQYAANFQFSATILKANNKLSVTAVPVGYSNNFNGFGTCTIERK